MLAVVKENPGTGFTVMETVRPVPGPGEVLIEVKAVGICGSDLPIFAGTRPVPLPFIAGHEFAGTIAALGPGVTAYKTGDRVAPGLVIHCGECLPCRRGAESLCDRIIETGIHVNGAFAEYVTVPEKTLHHLPDHLSFAQGAAIDPVASAYRPVKKACVGSEDTVVVFGPGPIGNFAAQIARAEGARKVILIGLKEDESRLALARSLGIETLISSNADDLANQIRGMNDGELPRVIIEATGNARVYSQCLDIIGKGGTLVVAGIVHELSSFDFAQVVRREISVIGSICYTWKEFQESLTLVAEGRVQVKPLMTHHLALQDLGEGLDAMIKRQAVKVMLYPGGREEL